MLQYPRQLAYYGSFPATPNIYRVSLAMRPLCFAAIDTITLEYPSTVHSELEVDHPESNKTPNICSGNTAFRTDDTGETSIV